LPPQAVERLPAQALENLPPELRPGPTFTLMMSRTEIVENSPNAFVFGLYPSEPPTSTISVYVAQTGGTATPLEDYYIGRNATATLYPGSTGTGFTFWPKDDGIVEGPETLVVSVYESGTGRLLATSGTFTILDDDSPAAPSADLSPIG
jgi:hypothetical protein